MIGTLAQEFFKVALRLIESSIFGKELRQALVHYRSLFETLLGGGASDQQLSRDTSTGEQSDVESPARS